MNLEEKYQYRNISLYKIRNRNEKRVIELLPEILSKTKGFEPNDIDIQDIYALALSKLPARYVQESGVVLQEPLKNEEIADAINEAIKTVKSNPNY